MSGSRRRNVRWQRLDRPGTERAALFPYKWTWHLRGKIETQFDGLPAKIAYEVVCDESWSPRVAVAKLRSAQTRNRFSLFVRDDGGWVVRGAKRVDLLGCTDVDLEASPSTNTLPIRRLGLKVGEAREVRAAWVRFPSLTVEPLRQRYTRVGETRYRYESLDSGFTAEVTVDDDGLVVEYPGFWRRTP